MIHSGWLDYISGNQKPSNNQLSINLTHFLVRLIRNVCFWDVEYDLSRVSMIPCPWNMMVNEFILQLLVPEVLKLFSTIFSEKQTNDRSSKHLHSLCIPAQLPSLPLESQREPHWNQKAWYLNEGILYDKQNQSFLNCFPLTYPVS